jgi:rare lipoprotein A
MTPRLLLLAALPLTLAACATGGNASRGAPKPAPGSVVQAPAPATPAAPKASPYAPAQEDLSKRGDYVAGGLYAPGVKDTVPDYVPNVDAIPEPEIRAEPLARWGNRPYTVLGQRYEVMDNPDGYVEQGGASYYGNKFHGRRTSSGEVYDMYAFTAAHRRRRAWPASWSIWRRSPAKAFTTRTPVTFSSTVVATSASRPCTTQDSGNMRLRSLTP